MTDEPTEHEDAEEAPEAPAAAPAAAPWNPQPWAVPPAAGWTTVAIDPASSPWEVPPGAAAPRQRRRWRRRLAVLTLVVVTLGVLGGGIAAAIDQHNAQVRRDRLAAQRRAEAAYRAAVTPLAVRMFDAVQPVQDALDAVADIRPGVSDARDDVILHGGALGEVDAVRQSVAGLKAPATQQAKAGDLLRAAADMSTALKKLREMVSSLRRQGGWSSDYSDAEDTFLTAESAWAVALSQLGQGARIPSPSYKRSTSYGRKVPTLGSLILGADLACGAAENDLYDIRHPKPANPIKTLPAEAKVLRRTVAALRRVPAPPARAALHERLDVELRSVLSLATSEEQMYTAFTRHDYQLFKKASDLWDEQTQALRRVDSTYQSLGVATCTVFFGTGDNKPTKKSLSA